MKPPRKVITGAQARSLAHLALNGIIERTMPEPRSLCVRFRTVYCAGHPQSNVFIERDGAMRSRLPHDHPVRRAVTAYRRAVKMGVVT